MSFWDGLKNFGKGIVNVFTGKSWNGDDPNKIKNEANKALAESQAKFNETLNAYNAQFDKMNSTVNSLNTSLQAEKAKSKNILLIGGLAVAGVTGYMLMSKKRR